MSMRFHQLARVGVMVKTVEAEEERVVAALVEEQTEVAAIS